MIKKIKIILLLLIAAMSNAKDNKVELELNTGMDVNFTLEGINKIFPMTTPVLKTFLPSEREDYVKVYKPKMRSNSIRIANNIMYNPFDRVDGTLRDVSLAFKYISEDIKFQKRFSAKIKENYLGLGAYIKLIGKENSYKEITGNNELETMKIGFNSDNKYLKFNIESYLKKDYLRKNIENIIEKEDNLKKSEVKYSFDINPLGDNNFKPSFKISGIDKVLEFGPSISYEKNGFFIGSSYMFKHGERDFDIKDELKNLRYVVPGYDKIEYFKKWTLKDKIPNLENKEAYNKEFVDLDNAKVSGFKGTSRMLGLASGSLYGDFPVKYVINLVREEIDKLPLSALGKKLHDIENKDLKKITDIASWKDVFSIPYIQDDIRQLTNVVDVNQIISNISNKMYKRLEISPYGNVTRSHILNQIPEEFYRLVPRDDNDVDFFSLDYEALDPNFMYFDGFKYSQITVNKVPTPVISDRSANDDKDYELKKQYHYVYNDVNYLVDDLKEYYKINKVLNLIDKGNELKGKKWYEKISGFFNLVKEGFKLKSDLEKSLGDYQEILTNPYGIKGLGFTRGIYLHASEKQKAMLKEDEILNPIIEKVSNEVNMLGSNTNTNLFFGYDKDGYLASFNYTLPKRIITENKRYTYSKNYSNYDLNLGIDKKGFILKTNLNLTESRNHYKDIDKNEFKYNLLDFNTTNYLGYNIKINKGTSLELGLGHYGEYTYIKPYKYIISGVEKEFEVAKRDKKNNPISVDGDVVIISEHTEKQLVDKVKSSKLKRDINASDYIAKEKSKAVPYLSKVYNILYPSLVLNQRLNDSLTLTNQIRIPVSFVNDRVDGFSFIYQGNIKYILSGGDILANLNTDLLKFRKNIDLELKYGSNSKKIDTYYDVDLDFGFSRLNLRSSNSTIPSFLIALNPIFIDTKVKPEVQLANENKSFVVKYGIRSSNKFTNSAVGLKKVIIPNYNIVDEIRDVNLDIVKNKKYNLTIRHDEYDNEKEYLQIKDIFEKEYDNLKSYNDSLVYSNTPYIEISRNTDKFSVKFNLRTTSASYNETTPKLKTTNFNEVIETIKNRANKDYLYRGGGDYFGSELHWKPYLINLKHEDYETYSKIKVGHKDYFMNLNLYTKNKVGFNFENRTTVKYEDNFITRTDVKNTIKYNDYYLLSMYNLKSFSSFDKEYNKFTKLNGSSTESLRKGLLKQFQSLQAKEEPSLSEKQYKDLYQDYLKNVKEASEKEKVNIDFSKIELKEPKPLPEPVVASVPQGSNEDSPTKPKEVQTELKNLSDEQYYKDTVNLKGDLQNIEGFPKVKNTGWNADYICNNVEGACAKIDDPNNLVKINKIRPRTAIKERISENVSSKKLTVNSVSNISYKVNAKDNFNVGVNLTYKLYINYLNMGNIILKDRGHVGRSSFEYSNILEPNITLENEMFNGLNHSLKIAVPFDVKSNIKTKKDLYIEYKLSYHL